MKLYAPPNDKIRPTTDRVREDIFNIISHKVYESVFLDLYAGTGAIGIEAVSRGAKSALLVDNSRIAINLIEKNIEKTKAENIRAIRYDVGKFLYNSKGSYDIIFMDPPYLKQTASHDIKTIVQRSLLAKGGIVVAEAALACVLPENIGHLAKTKYKAYSQTAISIYE